MNTQHTTTQGDSPAHGQEARQGGVGTEKIARNLLEKATTWAMHDPDPHTRAQLEALIAAEDTQALALLFAQPLAFGTAGIRAALGAGESRMNRAVVIRTTAGLMHWLRERIDTPTIVLGCDARHGSSQFLHDAAHVISAAGGTALVLPEKNPTPLTAFSVKALNADAGIMITASHNPPQDNGYKVYLGGRIAPGAAQGVQLIPPADQEIAQAIAHQPAADCIPRTHTGISKVDTRAEYADAAVALAGTHTDVRIALTAMHGVGAALGSTVLTRAGFDVSLVPEQAEPDPNFPTVAFPNPEEPGALDAAKKHATEVNADVIIAYDPDADRCAVAIPDTTAHHGWRQLTGDETGAVLGEYLASHGRTGAMASSIVSGRLLGRIAEYHGLQHCTTLTGFKWIARTPQLTFGYEEAIGFCCDPTHVADKDGISASVVLASLVGELKTQGKTLDDLLEKLASRHGRHATAPLTFRVDDLSLITQGMHTLRSDPPSHFTGSPVIQAVDLAKNELGIGSTEGMLFLTQANDRVICRPSGTEPKLKCYLEVVLEHGTAEDAAVRLRTISQELTAHLGM